LTHTKEKLGYVKTKFEELRKDNAGKE